MEQIKNWTKNNQRLNEACKKSVQIMNEELLNEPWIEWTNEGMNNEKKKQIKNWANEWRITKNEQGMKEKGTKNERINEVKDERMNEWWNEKGSDWKN